jgi:hypothetical protein
MASQLLVNVLPVVNLAGGASVTLAHGLRSGDQPVTPTQVLCDRASPLVVSAATDISITVTNPTASPLTANFRCEYDHSIHAVGATPTKWGGVPFTAAGVAVYGQFFSDLDQVISNGTGITLMSFENTSSANGVSVVDPGAGPTQLTVAAAGVYCFTLSPQLLKTAGGGSGKVAFWARKNGIDLPDSASVVALTNNQENLTFIELVVPMNAGDNVEWACNADVANCRLEHFPASVAPALVRPAVPSIIAGVKLIGT